MSEDPLRVGHPMEKTDEDKSPRILTGPPDQVSSRQIRARSVRAQHVAPGQVNKSHVSDDFFDLDSYVMISPDGTRWEVTIDNTGTLQTSALP